MIRRSWKSRRYRVTTWDTERQEFTPQRGLRQHDNLTIWQLKRALRTLQRGGYACHRDDSSVLVEEVTGRAAREMGRRIKKALNESNATAVGPA